MNDKIINGKLPAPRLQLRWAPSTLKRGYQWECHYELVLKLDKWDIRAEVYKGDRLLKKRLAELVVPMKEPSVRGSSSEYPPCTSGDGKLRYCDTPYRDGAHAKWDSLQVGNLPIYCIAPDGAAFLVEPLSAEHVAKAAATA